MFRFLFKRSLYHQEYSISREKISTFFSLITHNFIGVNLIRVGENNDGGYLLPSDFTNIEFCFSPGVENTTSFESELIQRGIHCYLADYSVEKSPITSDKVSFIKKYIGVIDNDTNITMDSWMNKNCLGSSGMGILQMDIEGSEYEAILSMSVENLLKFKYLLIEFHDLNALKSQLGFNTIFSTFSKILTYFNIVHIHPNNCFPLIAAHDFQIVPVMEFTFMNKSFSVNEQVKLTFPHKFDFKSKTENEDVLLPACWYPH